MATTLNGNARFYRWKTATTLNGTPIILKYRWNRRLEAWYIDLLTSTGTALAEGLRLSPGSSPFKGLSLPSAPAGRFVVRGADDYARTDLGDVELLRVEFWPADEVDGAVAAAAEVPNYTIGTVTT